MTFIDEMYWEDYLDLLDEEQSPPPCRVVGLRERYRQQQKSLGRLRKPRPKNGE